MKRLFAVFCFLAVTIAAHAVEPSEYAARRAAVAKAIGNDAMLVLLPSTAPRRNGDVSYPFRQSDPLLYLTGIDQADTSLVLLPGEKDFREMLFVSDSNPQNELWTGKVLTQDEAKKRTGIAQVVSASRMRPFVSAALEGRTWGEIPANQSYFRPPAMLAFRDAVRAGRAEVWLFLPRPRAMTGTPSPEQKFAEDLAKAYPEVRIRDASTVIDALREVKSAAELALIQKAIDITADGIKNAMRRALTASHEYQVQAALEQTFRDQGACCVGFPSIVGAGRNATILHYETNNDPIVRDGLVLTDVGAEVDGYTADVTRTFPADGTFSPEQKAIYEAVLAAQNAAAGVARPGKTQLDVYLKAEEALGAELVKLGLITKNEPEQVTMYLRHGTGHHLGLQVHDVFDRARKLEPGMVITIEPGVYVRENDIRASGAWKKLTAADQEKINAALAKYAGIGVRIEDDYVITNDGARLLSGRAPRTIEEIEKSMR